MNFKGFLEQFKDYKKGKVNGLYTSSRWFNSHNSRFHTSDSNNRSSDYRNHRISNSNYQMGSSNRQKSIRTLRRISIGAVAVLATALVASPQVVFAADSTEDETYSSGKIILARNIPPIDGAPIDARKMRTAWNCPQDAQSIYECAIKLDLDGSLYPSKTSETITKADGSSTTVEVKYGLLVRSELKHKTGNNWSTIGFVQPLTYDTLPWGGVGNMGPTKKWAVADLSRFFNLDKVNIALTSFIGEVNSRTICGSKSGADIYWEGSVPVTNSFGDKLRCYAPLGKQWGGEEFWANRFKKLDKTTADDVLRGVTIDVVKLYDSPLNLITTSFENITMMAVPGTPQQMNCDKHGGFWNQYPSERSERRGFTAQRLFSYSSSFGGSSCYLQNEARYLTPADIEFSDGDVPVTTTSPDPDLPLVGETRPEGEPLPDEWQDGGGPDIEVTPPDNTGPIDTDAGTDGVPTNPNPGTGGLGECVNLNPTEFKLDIPCIAEGLFVPSEGALKGLEGARDDLMKRAPFSYGKTLIDTSIELFSPNAGSCKPLNFVLMDITLPLFGCYPELRDVMRPATFWGFTLFTALTIGSWAIRRFMPDFD